MQKERKTVKQQNNKTLAIKQSQGPSVLHQGLWIIFWATSFELFCRYSNPHQVEEVNCLQRPQTCWNQKADDADSQPIRRKSQSRPHPAPWALLDSSLPLQGGHTVLRALASCSPLCLAKHESYSFRLHSKLCLQGLIQYWGTGVEFQQHLVLAEGSLLSSLKLFGSQELHLVRHSSSLVLKAQTHHENTSAQFTVN